MHIFTASKQAIQSLYKDEESEQERRRRREGGGEAVCVGGGDERVGRRAVIRLPRWVELGSSRALAPVRGP